MVTSSLTERNGRGMTGRVGDGVIYLQKSSVIKLLMMFTVSGSSCGVPVAQDAGRGGHLQPAF